jgi:hypothetical protein
VVADRLVDIFTLMERFDRQRMGTVALCTVAAEFLELDGSGIALRSDDDVLTTLCTSDPIAQELMDLEVIVGEGPAVHASQNGAIEVPNLLDATLRWPMYSPRALDLGVRAVFGYEVRFGAIRFGALSLFRESSGPLTGTQVSDGYLMASVIARSVLTQQAGVTYESLSGEIGVTSTLDFSVHQAAGMVAIQGFMSVRDALVTLRAHAFASNCQLSDLAERVVSRETRFESESGTWKTDPDAALAEA